MHICIASGGVACTKGANISTVYIHKNRIRVKKNKNKLPTFVANVSRKRFVDIAKCREKLMSFYVETIICSFVIRV